MCHSHQMHQQIRGGLAFQPGFEAGLAGAKLLCVRPENVIDAGLPSIARSFKFLHKVSVKAQRDWGLGATAHRSARAAHLLELGGAHFIGVRVGCNPSGNSGIFSGRWQHQHPATAVLSCLRHSASPLDGWLSSN